MRRALICQECGGDRRYTGPQRGCRCADAPGDPNCLCKGSRIVEHRSAIKGGEDVGPCSICGEIIVHEHHPLWTALPG